MNDLYDVPAHSQPRKDMTLIVGSLLIITLAVATFTAFPVQSKALAEQAFNGATSLFGPWVQLLGFFAVLVTFALAFSKFGNIRLGEGRPQYSTTGWVFMFICAGLGSATMYWAFMEWGYYYLMPGPGVPAMSPKALEYSTAYSFFHWGITPWAMYALGSLAMAYHFHVRCNKGLSLANVVETITGLSAKGPVGRVMTWCSCWLRLAAWY